MLGIHPQALLLRAQRAELISNNIANADTPGYKARDIDFQSVLESQTARQTNAPRSLSTAGLRQTHPDHLSASVTTTNNETLYRTPTMPSLDGNSVDVQMEQTAFAENTIQYLASLRFVNGKIKGMMSAIKGE